MRTVDPPPTNKFDVEVERIRSRRIIIVAAISGIGTLTSSVVGFLLWHLVIK